MVCQRLGCPICTWGDQVPDKTLDVLVSTVMQQAVGQEGPADSFHIGLFQRTLEATVSQDVIPPTPPENVYMEKRIKENIFLKPDTL